MKIKKWWRRQKNKNKRGVREGRVENTKSENENDEERSSSSTTNFGFISLVLFVSEIGSVSGNILFFIYW